MNTPAAEAELATMEAVSRWGTVSIPPGEVLVVALAPHKVGAPRTPDDRVKYWPGQHYTCTPEAAQYAASRGLVHISGEIAYDWWGAPRRVLSSLGADVRPLVTHETPGALRIAMGVGYDPGSCCYRTASAINQHSKHAAMFVRWGDTNPHSSFRQWDGETDGGMVRAAVETADVLHNHMAYYLNNNTGLQPRADQVLVIHYHGSRPDYSAWPVRSAEQPLCADRFKGAGMSFIEWDVARGAKVVGARLQLCDEIARGAAQKGVAVVAEWLPIPMPIEEYAALVTRPAWRGSSRRSGTANTPPKFVNQYDHDAWWREEGERMARIAEDREDAMKRGDVFRIAHSPTNRRFKGSDQYETIIAALQAQGLPIERVDIMGMKHQDALRLKATCHATFDSYWLGMQGSGLEAAAMGQPVLAGDADAADAHRRFCGDVPWTYTPDLRELREAIERLVTDVDYYAAEAARVARFVKAHHSYAAVARRYEQLLAQWTGRTDVATTIPAASAVRIAPRKRKRAA